MQISGKAPMLLVKDSMSRQVVALPPQATAGEALALCRERRIRHMPVLEDGRLVGIVSDRDLRSATPALGDPARAEALGRILISEVMASEVTTALPDDPIEEAANAMREKKIGCLPVVEDENLVGIISSSDVMEALVYLMGAHEPGNRLEVVMPDRPGTLAGVAGIFGELGINIVSAVLGPRRDLSERGEPGRVAVFRVDTMDLREAVEILESAGYDVLWPPEQ
ncbi:MAG TPA: acetoin utilization AcuB family protein [Rubrobacteraceae bacterium]|nr:acetoin utilization AcuB family protein [Rubrobacteraceae bacterium]